MKKWLSTAMAAIIAFSLFAPPTPAFADDTDYQLLNLDLGIGVDEQDFAYADVDLYPVSIPEPERPRPVEALLERYIEASEEGEISISASDAPIKLMADDGVGDGVTSSMSTFNRVTSPAMTNQANAPKYNAGLNAQEEISPYTGDLTVRMNDISLPGRNGLDLNIGRTYQSNQTAYGELKIQVFVPRVNLSDGASLFGDAEYALNMTDTSYLKDRYNLGLGWQFSFPSLQVEKEYIGVANSATFSYNTELTMYYHTGSGSVYEVEFTPDTTDSNLKDYYEKDIKFDYAPNEYTNGQVINGQQVWSAYSMTRADQTKEYFAADGRLIGIKDRFNNVIKFEHTMRQTHSGVPNGNFEADSYLWYRSNNTSVRYDNAPNGTNGQSLRFVSGDRFAASNLIWVEPSTSYTLSADFWHGLTSNGAQIEVRLFDTSAIMRATNPFFNVGNLTASTWTNKNFTINTTSATRYVQIVIHNNGESNFYVDNVAVYKPQPIISKITDTIGRTVTFNYSAEPKHSEDVGKITLTVKSPNGSETKTIEYLQNVFQYQYVNDIKTSDYWERRFVRGLECSFADGFANAPGTKPDNEPVYYFYDGDKLNGSSTTELLKWSLDHKNPAGNVSKTDKMVLDRIRYKNIEKIYTYEKVAKHMGSGFYETLRVKQRHDRYGYMATPSSEFTSYQGEESKVTYSYAGKTAGNVDFYNETGFPDYNFSNTTTLNETWECTQTSHFDSTTTNRLKTVHTFSNAKLTKTEVTNLSVNPNQFQRTEILTRHGTFKNSPTAVRNTVGTTAKNSVTYVDTTYNAWGGVETQTKAVPSSLRNNPKYTVTYDYNSKYKFLTEKKWYDSEDGEQLSERTPYDTNGRLTSTTNAAGEKTEYFYENTSYPGNVTKIVQDDPENMHKTISNQQKVITFAYDTYNAYVASQSETVRGITSTTQYIYEYIWGQPKKITNPDNGYTEYEYYPESGRLHKEYSPYVQTSGGRFRYYDQYQDAKMSGASYKNSTLYVFDTIRHVKRIQIEGSGATSIIGQGDYLYDKLGNLALSFQVDLTRPLGGGLYQTIVNGYFYDAAGRLERTQDAAGNNYQYAYDPLGRLTTVTDPRNSQYKTVYNDADLTKLSYFIPMSATSTQENHILEKFDIYGNMTERIGYPDGYSSPAPSSALTESFQYDIAGHVTAITDPKLQKTEYQWDGAGRLAKVIYPNGESAGSLYNKLGNPSFEKQYSAGGAEVSGRISITDERGNAYLRFYSESKTLRESNNYSYNKMGLLESKTEGGKTFGFLYDPSGNVTKYSAPNGGEVNYTYHPFGVQTKTPNSGAVSALEFGYDAMGRFGRKKQDSFGNTLYTYNPVGTVKDMTNPFSMETGYTYDTNLRVQNITADSKTYVHDYYDDGMIKSITYPNVGGQTLKTNYTYDNLNRVKTIITLRGATTVSSLTYGYDKNSNITSEARTGIGTTNYTYDDLNRLKTAQYPGVSGTTTYYYEDAKGNRTREVNGANEKIYRYDKDNRLQSVRENGIITESYEYNSVGALTVRNGETFSYDDWNRMSGHTKPAAASDTFKYDAEGLRTAKNNTQYITDPSGRVIAEANAGGTVTAQMVYGAAPLARKEGSNWYYYITNAHGDVIDVLDAANGSSVKSYTFDAWGNIIGETGSFNQPIRYAGEYYDSELDMYYLRARYFDPKVGRFISNDPVEPGIAQPYAMNRYLYCHNNPILYVDPTGLTVRLLTDIAAERGVSVSWNGLSGSSWAVTVGGVTITLNQQHPNGDWLLNIDGFALSGNELSLHADNNRVYIDDGVFSCWIDDGSGAHTDWGATLAIAAPIGLVGGYLMPSIGAGSSVTVLGSNPDYLNKARELGARAFSVPTNVWNAMTSAEQWAMNKQFLDESIRMGHEFVMTYSAHAARAGSFFEKEVNYLLQQGYRIVENGMRMIK